MEAVAVVVVESEAVVVAELPVLMSLQELGFVLRC